jgi:hypothetical protein
VGFALILVGSVLSTQREPAPEEEVQPVPEVVGAVAAGARRTETGGPVAVDTVTTDDVAACPVAEP